MFPIAVAPSTPTIILDQQMAQVNRTLVLTCTTQGGPNNMLQWYKNGELLADWQDSLSIETDNSYSTSISSNLTFVSLAADDQGNYTCAVTNAAGNDSTTVLLVGKCWKLTV